MVRILTSLVLLFPAASWAGPWYVGLGGGVSRPVESNLLEGYGRDGYIQNRTILTSRSERKEGAWKVFGGWQATPHFALEASYAALGRESYAFRGSRHTGGHPGGFKQEDSVAERRVEAWGIDIVGRWPLSPAFDVVGSLGVARMTMELEASAFTSFLGVRDRTVASTTRASATVARYGAGLRWKPTPGWALGLAYERLGEGGTEFRISPDRHTGRSGHDAAWLSVMRTF